MGRKPRRRLTKPAEALVQKLNEHAGTFAGEPQADSLVVRPISPVINFSKKPLPNWKLHLVIFLALAIGCLIGFSLATRAHGAAPEPPRIGRLTLPAPWWEIVKQAAQENDLDPCLIMAVMAIESRFYRYSINKRHKCYGLMQLQKDVCRIMGVGDPFDPEQNIRAGTKILARLWQRYDGDVRRVLKKYNPTDTGAYSREVIKAWKQARRNQDGGRSRSEVTQMAKP